MRVFAPILLAAAAFAAPGSALGADASGKYSIRGAGTIACSAYIKATPAQKQFAETWWAGYLTAMNRSTANTYEVLGDWSVEQANAWLLTYCTQNPDAKLAVAVHKMLEAAYPTRKQSSE